MGRRRRGADRTRSALGRLLARLRDERDRDPTLLDATALGFAAALPGELVVTPLDATRLPYADHSFDVVAVDRDETDRVALARRLAVRAVACVAPEGALQILWQGAVSIRRWSFQMWLAVSLKTDFSGSALSAETKPDKRRYTRQRPNVEGKPFIVLCRQAF